MAEQHGHFGNGRLDILVSVAGGSGPIETVSRQTRARPSGSPDKISRSTAAW